MICILCRYREQHSLHRGGNGWLVPSDKHPEAVPKGLDSKLSDVGILARVGAGSGHQQCPATAAQPLALTVLLKGLLESSLEKNEDSVLE